MNEYEALSPAISAAGVLIAIWAIVVSRSTANEQKQLAQRAHLLEARNLAATHHGKYSELLFAVRSDVQVARDRLAGSARKNLGKICDLFDQFGSMSGGRATHHIFQEACESIYEAFRPQLTWQTGLNLLHRYQVFQHAEDEIQIHPKDRPKLEAKAVKEALDLGKEYKRHPNKRLEQLVLSSSRFRLHILELQDRVNPESRDELFQTSLPHILEYVHTHEAVCEQLEGGHARLADALEQNKLEEFSLRESPGLYAEYKGELAKLNALKELRPYGVDSLVGVRLHTPISKLIHVGALLYTIQMCWGWGGES